MTSLNPYYLSNNTGRFFTVNRAEFKDTNFAHLHLKKMLVPYLLLREKEIVSGTNEEKDKIPTT